MEKKLKKIRRVLVKNFGDKDFKFKYFDYYDLRNFMNKEAFPNESYRKEYEKFKKLYKTDFKKYSFIRLIFIDLLILTQPK